MGAGSVDDSDDSSHVVEWAGHPERDYRPHVAHLALSAAVVFLFIILSVMVSSAVALAGSNPSSLVLGVLLFVGGPGSLVYLWLANEYSTDEANATLPQYKWVKPTWLLAALPFGALVVLSIGLFPPLFIAWLFVFVIAYAAAASRHTHGRIDTETGEVAV
jgi:hypothetical protein